MNPVSAEGWQTASVHVVHVLFYHMWLFMDLSCTNSMHSQAYYHVFDVAWMAIKVVTS